MEWLIDGWFWFKGLIVLAIALFLYIKLKEDN